MPELPEVRTVSRSLNDKVAGKTITDVNIFLPKLVKEIDENEFKKQVENCEILSVSNLGKFILFDLGKVFLVSHLRMEGKYRVEDKSNDLRKHDHFIFNLDSNEKMIYNDTRAFGTFHIRTKENYNLINPLMKLAKEPQETDVKILHKILSKKSSAIKTVLLDQTILVGLGNIYVNEVLWELKINPTTPANKVSEKLLSKILITSADIMDRSTELGGTTISSYESLNNQEGKFQNFLKVHMKDKEECPRCKNIILKMKVNGRGTYYCGVCQK